MIQVYSSTIRRKEMEAVLTCMVDEKIGPGEMNAKLVQLVKEYTDCDGAVAFRSPSIALEYALKALDVPAGSGIVLSALAPAYQVITIEKLGYKAVILDVNEETGAFSAEDAALAVNNEGGRVIILPETMGILPDIKSFQAIGVPLIEDISQSALSYYPFDETDEYLKKKYSKPQVDKDGNPVETKGRRAGMYGVFALMGMEENDIITSGGGAVLMAFQRKDWSALKHLTDAAPSTDILPDMNSALAFVEIKEFARNEKVRREIFELYNRAIMSGKHKTFVRPDGDLSTVCLFPLVLNSGFKDAKSYAAKKNIEVRHAFENSIVAMRQEELQSSCICANSLLLRCALFPLYPRLGRKETEIIVKVLSSML